MAPPRKTLLRPLGLVTQPNKFGWFKDGALSRAINCVMRNPGELDAAPSTFSSSNTGSAGNTLYKLVPLNASHVYELSATAGDVWSVQENNNGAPLPSFVSTTSLFSRTGRISPLRTKDRMLLNSNFGYLVGDNMAPTTSGERTLRLAGLPQPSLITSGSTVPATGGSIVPPASGTLVWGYQVIHTRTFSDGYALVSVPTPVLKQLINVGGSERVPFVDILWASTVAIVGDVIELYRTDGLATTDFNADPPSVYRLVASVTLTASDISAGSVRINDYAKMGDAPYYTTGGRELYCNPGQGGATTINRQPPIAACTANFDGRTFYGNTTDRPKCTLQIPGGVGSSFDPARQTDYWRRHGIGTRLITGAATIGSAVITGVSATDIVGIVPGQRWYSSSTALFNRATAFVSSVNVGAGTITMNQTASASSAAGSMSFADCLYIGFNGGTLNPYQFADLGDLIIHLGGAGLFTPASPANQFEITSNSAFYGGSVGATILAGTYNANLSISIEPKNHGSGFVSMQITATNSANYSPPLAEFNTTAKTFARTTLKNRLTWSKDQQPEHVPPGGAQVNETFVGLREIISMASTRDALWIACLDGIFRLSGIGGQYRLDQIDSTKIICAPQAMDVLDESVYIYTNFGLLELNSEQRDNLTDLVIGDLLPGPQYAETNAIQVVCNETDLEVLMLDVSSADRLYVYATREGSGWTTLENNAKPGPLSNITTLAFQRSTSSGDPRILVGVSPLGGVTPSYAGWGNTASFLAMDVLYQPTYQNDPVSLKQWIEASYIFDAGNAGKTLRPVWNGVAGGSSTVALYQNAAYARAGVPRDHAVAQSIQVGFDSVTTTAPQARFLGFSVLYNPLTTQAKQRT